MSKKKNEPMNEIIKPEHQQVMTTLEDNTWGASETLASQDLLVAKIFHQQALSKFVQDGGAAPGDWCDSLTGEVLAKKDEPLELIIFSSFKKLLISKAIAQGGNFEFIETQDITEDNVNAPWLEETEGGVIKRQLQYNYFVLLPHKINELPYVISFSSTKIRAAKKLNTMIAKLARFNKPSAHCIFELRTIKETGDKGNWFGVEVTQGRDLTPEELNIAHGWYMQAKKSGIKVAEAESTEAIEPSYSAQEEDRPGF